MCLRFRILYFCFLTSWVFKYRHIEALKPYFYSAFHSSFQPCHKLNFQNLRSKDRMVKEKIKNRFDDFPKARIDAKAEPQTSQDLAMNYLESKEGPSMKRMRRSMCSPTHDMRLNMKLAFCSAQLLITYSASTRNDQPTKNIWTINLVMRSD